MQHKDLEKGDYFVVPAMPDNYYQKLNDNHAFEVPPNTTLPLGPVQIHIDPEREVIPADYIPAPKPPEPK